MQMRVFPGHDLGQQGQSQHLLGEGKEEIWLGRAGSKEQGRDKRTGQDRTGQGRIRKWRQTESTHARGSRYVPITGSALHRSPRFSGSGSWLPPRILHVAAAEGKGGS